MSKSWYLSKPMRREAFSPYTNPPSYGYGYGYNRQQFKISSWIPSYSLGIVITTHRRPDRLIKSFRSALHANPHHIVVAATGVNRETEVALNQIKSERPGTKILTWTDDPGCNTAWMGGVAHCDTSHVVILHDDDLLLPGAAMLWNHLEESTVVTWQAVFHEDLSGPHRPFNLPAGEHIPHLLLHDLLSPGRFSATPVCGMFRKDIALAGLKVAERMHSQEWLIRPGMMVGNDLILWMHALTHSAKARILPQTLTSLGTWKGSTTGIYSTTLGSLYDSVRSRWMADQPRFVHVSEWGPKSDPRMVARDAVAMRSWDAISPRELYVPARIRFTQQSSSEIGDARCVPKLKDMLRAGLESARDGDFIFFTNADSILDQRILMHIWKHLSSNNFGCMFRVNTRKGSTWTDGGRDLFAWRKSALAEWINEIPDFWLGTNHWDTCLAIMGRLKAGIFVGKHDFRLQHPKTEINHGPLTHEWHAATGNANTFRETSLTHEHNLREFARWLHSVGLPNIIPHWVGEVERRGLDPSSDPRCGSDILFCPANA